MPPPKFRKNRPKETRITHGELKKRDPYEMNAQIYAMILAFIKKNNLKLGDNTAAIINKLIPGKPELYTSFRQFKRRYDADKRLEKKQAQLDGLNKVIDNMEEHREFGLSLVKKRAKKSKDNPYQVQFDFLDKNIELIENLIYLCVSPKRICQQLHPDCTTLTPIIFHHWKDETTHIDRLIFAYKASAEEHINKGMEFMKEWLAAPELDMQHVGIVREIGIYHSRMAEFLDRKKWGKKVEVVDERPQQKVLDGRDLNAFLQGINDAADRMREKREDEPNDNDEYEDAEEVE